eukprot:TRINITY_DN1819_c0_g1_i4.p1 TRINITY_DN1819_c0_g1~~TRINITY_DN1819_c0_g1_i4.p1  ORF type:complete len:150 (+),score=53.77 TRINITY_DN1819_c0_g1_i4:313-762(+)
MEEEEWHALCVRAGCAGDVERAWHARLRDAYGAQGRHYHTLAHVSDLLRLVRAHAGLLTDPDAARFAAWFHDAVYDAQRGDNEEQSAALFAAFASEAGMCDDLAGRVRHLIMCTAHHEVLPHAEERLVSDSRFFLDFDLSVLGSDPARA